MEVPGNLAEDEDPLGVAGAVAAAAGGGAVGAAAAAAALAAAAARAFSGVYLSAALLEPLGASWKGNDKISH